MRSLLWPVLALLLAACAPLQQPGASAGPSTLVLPSPVLLYGEETPALFLEPRADAPQIAYLSSQVPLHLSGEQRDGYAFVRIDGPLRVRGFVPLGRLGLRVQRRGRLRGAPVYVGPGDLLQLVGPGEEPGRLRVRAHVRAGALPFPPLEGSYPSAGLGAKAAPEDAQAPDPGRSLVIAAGTSLALHENPGQPAALSTGPLPGPVEATVVTEHQGWLALRLGPGPYVIGWAPAANIEPGRLPGAVDAPSAPTTDVGSARTTAHDPSSPPTRVANEPGALKRVAAGTKVGFGNRVTGVFKEAGWARVLNVYPSGFADVFAAVNDDVTIRGLVRTSDLLEP